MVLTRFSKEVFHSAVSDIFLIPFCLAMPPNEHENIKNLEPHNIELTRAQFATEGAVYAA